MAPKKTASPGLEDSSHLKTLVFRSDGAEPVACLVRVVGALDGEDVGQMRVAAVALRRDGIRIHGLVLAALRDPEAAVLLIGAVERHPGSEQRVRLRDDMEGVLVVALARGRGRLAEEHRLEGKHIGPTRAGHAVHDPRVQQEALVDLQFAMPRSLSPGGSTS